MSVCHNHINVFNKQHPYTLHIHLILKCLHCFPQELDTFLYPSSTSIQKVKIVPIKYVDIGKNVLHVIKNVQNVNLNTVRIIEIIKSNNRDKKKIV